MGLTKKLFKKSFLGLYATRVLKGCLFLLTMLVAVSDHDMTSKDLIIYILLAFSAVTVIDIYCQIIGDQINTRVTLTIPVFWHAVGDFLPQMGPGLIGAFVFTLSAVKAISINTAFSVTEIICTALMILFCYASQRLTHKKRWRAAGAALIAALIGLGFVYLRGCLS